MEDDNLGVIEGDEFDGDQHDFDMDHQQIADQEQSDGEQQNELAGFDQDVDETPEEQEIVQETEENLEKEPELELVQTRDTTMQTEQVHFREEPQNENTDFDMQTEDFAQKQFSVNTQTEEARKLF